LQEKHFQKIVNILAELKDTSEVMLDLAYSSILLNNKELANEVNDLEEHLDNLHTEFELLVLSSSFNPKESKDFLGLIRLGVVTEEIADAAKEIGEVVLRGLKPHSVLRIVIEEAEETVTFSNVSNNSPLNGFTLKEAKIPNKTGFWVLAIKRGKSCLRPKPDLKIKAGDILIASGYSEGEEDFKKLCEGDVGQEENIN
jgi:uncharacterized protein with PhoU and TrkA domain